MSIQRTLGDYPDISFIGNMTIEDIQDYYLKYMREKYEELTGKKLVMGKADPLRLIAYANCLLLYQIAQYTDRAGKLSLLKYSYGNYLENIGALKGISRMEGTPAKTKIKFTLSEMRSSTTIIPKGTRVTASDGVYFCTLDILEIPAGKLAGEVNAECKESGTKGNGYKPGDLATMVDPVAYIESVENITTTEGGADLETDENLAERIYLAPSSWSTAGPDDAYKYWVKTFDAGITDVMVRSDVPGIVDIRFIMQNGELPQEALLEEVSSFLSDEKIRPLTDMVVVQAPEVQEYEIDITYYVNDSDRMRTVTIQEEVDTAVNNYVLWQQEKIGRDINPDQLRKMVIAAGAKRVEVRSPCFKKIHYGSIAGITNRNVLYGGIEDD